MKGTPLPAFALLALALLSSGCLDNPDEQKIQDLRDNPAMYYGKEVSVRGPVYRAAHLEGNRTELEVGATWRITAVFPMRLNLSEGTYVEVTGTLRESYNETPSATRSGFFIDGGRVRTVEQPYPWVEVLSVAATVGFILAVAAFLLLWRRRY